MNEWMCSVEINFAQLLFDGTHLSWNVNQIYLHNVTGVTFFEGHLKFNILVNHTDLTHTQL